MNTVIIYYENNHHRLLRVEKNQNILRFISHNQE